MSFLLLQDLDVKTNTGLLFFVDFKKKLTLYVFLVGVARKPNIVSFYVEKPTTYVFWKSVAKFFRHLRLQDRRHSDRRRHTQPWLGPSESLDAFNPHSCNPDSKYSFELSKAFAASQSHRPSGMAKDQVSWGNSRRPVGGRTQHCQAKVGVWRTRRLPLYSGTDRSLPQ